MELTGLQIFKYTPAGKKEEKANCKECGCPTCMMFSLKLAKEQINIEKCPYVSEELINIFEKGKKHPQKTIEIGNLKIGGENVLYRHEKTFINRTTIAIIVDCSLDKYEEKITQINNYEINRVNEILKTDLIILKNYKNQNIKSDVPFITLEDLKKYEFDFIKEEDFQTTKNYLINCRTKAIIDKDDSCSKPTCVFMKNSDSFSICARAAYYLCKYANMLVFEDFDKEMISTLLTLRQNIFTDPQKTLQVESGLYKFNNPDKNSIILMTTNFALTFFAVSNELESIDIPSYLIILPAQGMSVLTAWSAETLTAETVKETLKKLNIREQINTRKIIIPGLISNMKEELSEQCPDFEFIEGTHEASDITNFVENFIKKE